MTPVTKIQAGPKIYPHAIQPCPLYLPAGCAGANDALLIVSNFGNIFLEILPALIPD